MASIDPTKCIDDRFKVIKDETDLTNVYTEWADTYDEVKF